MSIANSEQVSLIMLVKSVKSYAVFVIEYIHFCCLCPYLLVYAGYSFM